MDGASIAAIEPKVERRPLQAAPLRAQLAEPIAEAEPELETAAALSSAFDSGLALEPREEEQPDIFTAAAAELAAEPPMGAQPTVVQPTVTRIVDPSVAEEGELEDEAPLFAPTPYEPRKPRGGFLSIFGGRPRFEPQEAAPARATAGATPAPVRGGAQPLEVPAAMEEAEDAEDLEIPSFLRRLAN
jgi:cell division protein FtsZ